MNPVFLTRIAIRNFRTFGNFEIDVPAAPGLILVTGTNGLGKSSFFDAIEWGLTSKVRRFEPYLQKGRKTLVEKDYLTRRGADPGSHSVSLTFSGGASIERSATGGTTMEDIVSQLARPGRRAINDLGTYLALTHFLGQAAQQRFTSRDSQDQWRSLKGPSGVDRLERIRTGLRGRPTVAAFSRRLEKEQALVTSLERQIADWQGWVMRLERLYVAARASGVLSTNEVATRINQLEADLQQLVRDQQLAVIGESIGQRLATLGERIGNALQVSDQRRATMEAVSGLPTQFAISQEEGRLDHPSIERFRSAVSDAQARFDRALPLIDSTRAVVTAQSAAITTIDHNISVLDAARTDLLRRTQLSELLQSEEQDRAALTDAIAEHRAMITAADAMIRQHGELLADVARLRNLATSARALNDAIVTDYLNLEAEAGMTAGALLQGREVAVSAAAALLPLEQQLAYLNEQIADAERGRAEVYRHASAIGSALSQLASHLHEDDSNCPVCRTQFEPGVLKSLAEVAASASDHRLAKADETLESLRSKHPALNKEMGRLRSEVAAITGLERAAVSAADAVTDARAAIARTLAVSKDSDLVTIASARAREAEAALAAAQKALDPLATNAAAATQQRSSASADLDELITRNSQFQARLAQFEAEDKACADRVAARNLSDTRIGDIEARLMEERERIEAARARLAVLTEAASATVAHAQFEQAAADAALRDLAAAEVNRENAVQTAWRLQQRWSQAGFKGIPSQAEYERGLTAIEAVLLGLRLLKERQLLLAHQNEDALLQSEADEIAASMHATGGEDGGRDPAAYLANLKAKFEEARAAVKITITTRNAVKRYSEELQAQADNFSTQVLDPLNTVIDNFNEAMLSTPGESIQFKAEARVDATTFGMALRYREQAKNAAETQRDLPPQIVLSEGQLAANGFSILCAASTAYPWSRWKALLLDDPLQHNDIIHTAAFVDVMRNMVELNGYQLIMSSHDRGESDFIARKFDAAGLPCTTVLLTAPSDKGVVWAAPKMNQAAMTALRDKQQDAIDVQTI